MDTGDLANRFTYHAPASEDIKVAHELVRSSAFIYAGQLNELLPESREKSLAITHLEEVVFWANAALARNQK